VRAGAVVSLVIVVQSPVIRVEALLINSGLAGPTKPKNKTKKADHMQFDLLT
jgi:hypothetical protein